MKALEPSSQNQGGASQPLAREMPPRAHGG